MSDLIIKHLENIQERLSRIENRLDIQTTPVRPHSTSVPVSEPLNESSSPVCYAPEIETNLATDSNVMNSVALDAWADGDETVTPSATASEKYKDSNLHTTSTNWLGYAAIICFVLAAGFIIKLSIDSGWLTPLRQVALSALLGGSMIAAGLKFMKTDREYASLLPSGGVIILYLTSFAAYRYYNLVSFETAIFFTTLVSALCISLYAKIRHDIYAITACIGTYISPIILDLHADSDFTLYYFLVCSLAFATISIFLQSRLIILVAAYLAIVITTLIGLDIHQNELVSIVLAFQFLIFTFSTFFYSKRNGKPLTSFEAWSFSPVLLVFYTAEYKFIEQVNPIMAPWMSIWFGGVLLGLYLAAKKLFPQSLASQGLIISFVTLVFFHAGYLELLPDAMHPWLLAAIPLAAALLPKKFIGSMGQKFDSVYFLPLLAIGLIVPIEYLSLMVHLLSPSYASFVWPALATVATIWLLLILKADMIRNKVEIYGGLLASAHVLAIVGLYRLGVDTGSLAVSALWLFYAAGIMVFAATKKDEIMAKSALFVLAFAAGKALLYDASSAPTVVRIFCLLLTGAVLYGCGFLLRKIGNWKKVESI